MRGVIVLLSFCVVSSLASSYGLRSSKGGQSARERLIVESPETSVTKYPSAAMILDFNDIVNSFFYFCGGVIVNMRSILTAAPCVDDYVPVETWRVRVGSSYILSGGVIHTASKIFLHPDYNSCTRENSIALLRSGTVFDYNDNVNRAPIAGRNYIIDDNEPVWAIGWGANGQWNSPWNSTEKLREMQIFTINRDTCSEFYKSGTRLTVTQQMICTGLLGVSGRRPCINNDGTPVYHNGVLVGIRVWQYLYLCEVNVPEVNMKVSSYVDWMQDNI